LNKSWEGKDKHLFSCLFFILLVLALISFVPELQSSEWISSPVMAFGTGLLLYGIFLLFIYLQIKSLRKSMRVSSNLIITFINLELLTFLCLYYFGLGAHRLFSEGARLSRLQTPLALTSLFLYALGLGWGYYWLARFHLIKTGYTPSKYAYTQLQFLFPFCLPFILFTFLFDGLNFIPQWTSFVEQSNDSVLYAIILSLLSLVLLSLTMIFMPPLIVACWRCKPLCNPAILAKLQAACEQTRFKHGGFKVWTIMRHTFTAGIVGIIPRFRYIMFTPSLMNEFSPDEIEAILIHEMGHSHYKHLLFYPFILLGMLMMGAFLSFFYTDALSHYFAH
jgi:Zn-dependent protease with chaperone function